jgi:hypothetical protein
VSDFLSRLAERAIAPTPAVRPRLVSLFEPVAAANLPPLERHVEVDAPLRHAPERAPREPIRDSAESGTVVMPIRSRPPSAQNDAGTIVEPLSDEPRRPQRADIARFAAPVAAESPAHAVEAGERPAPLHVAPLVGAAEQRPARPETRTFTEETHAEKSRHLTHNADAPTSPRLAPAPPPIIQTTAPTQRNESVMTRATAIPPVASPRPSARAWSAERPTPQPVARPGQPTPPVERAEAIRVQPALTVHVTIGRVEIRAVPPPSSATVPRDVPTTSGLSLDEYLKRGAGAR